MRSIYKKRCFFSRRSNAEEKEGKLSCQLQRWTCFWCPFYFPDIKGLGLCPRDYIGIGSNREWQTRTFVFSVLALAISFIVLLLKVMEFIQQNQPP